MTFPPALGLLLAVCVGLSSCAPKVQAPVAPALRIASYEWPGSYWIEVALNKGWFRDEGLNVVRIDADRKYFESQDALAHGQLDAMGFSHFDLVRHVSAGHDLVGIAALDYSEGAEGLVAQSSIHRTRDLKGKKIAVHRGTYLEYLLSIAAERDGLDLRDVTLIDRNSEHAVNDFKAGLVDAIFVWEPYVNEAHQHGGNVLFSTADFPGLTYSVLTLRREYILEHREQVAALVRVWHRAERYVRENPVESSAIVAKYIEEKPQDVLALMRTVRVLDLADNGRAFSYAAGFESLHGSWRRMNDFMLEQGLVTKRVDSPEHLDSSFIRRLE